MNTKYFKVQAKCGHVGRNHYILKWFYVKALTGEEAAKVVRDKPMLSISDVFSEDEVRDFIRKVEDEVSPEYVCEQKKLMDLEYP